MHSQNSNYRRVLISLLMGVVALVLVFLVGQSFYAQASKGANKIVFDGHLYDEKGGLDVSALMDIAGSPDRENVVRDAIYSALTEGYHWLWFSADQLDGNTDYLKLGLAWLDKVTLFYVADDGTHQAFKAGDEDSFVARVVSFRQPVFPYIDKINGSNVDKVFLQVSAQGYFSLPLFSLDEKSFNRQRNLDYFFYLVWGTMLVALGVYNATIFFSLRNDIHFYYMLYLTVFAALLLTASGLGQQYIWPQSEGLTTHLANLFLVLINICTVLFVIRFVSLKDYSQRLKKLLLFFAYFSAACIPLFFFFGYRALQPLLICSFFIMILVYPAAIVATLNGNRVAPFLLASNVVLFPTNSIGLLRFMGLFENQSWTEHVAELGMATDALILALGLAYRVSLLRKNKEAILRERESEKSKFARQLILTKEQERKAVGKAIHDSLGHKILTVKNSVNAFSESGETALKHQTLTMLDETLNEIRDISQLLYPSILEHIGLEKAVSNMVSKALANVDVSCVIDIDVFDLGDEIDILLYRAAQECVNNLLKHSDASTFNLTIKTTTDGDVEFSATDNGTVGFSSSDFGFGLSTLQQHVSVLGGKFTVERTLSQQNKIGIRFRGVK